MAYLLAVALLALVAACGNDDVAAPGTTESTTSSTATTLTSTTEPVDLPDCSPDEVLQVVEDTLSMVRLGAGGEWTLGEASESAFSERTIAAATYSERLGLDCSLEAVQRTDSGDERFVLAAWTGERITFVLQASDGPTTAYEPTAMWDVSIEHVRGEYFEGPFRPNRDAHTTWAATLEGGGTFVVHARDYPAGPAAKDWLAGLEFQEPEEYVTLPAERFGIDALRGVGARNVDVADLPEFGSEIGYLHFVTPQGMVGETRVAPLGWFDVTTEWHGRPVTTETIGGIEVYVSEAGPPDDADILTYDVAHFSFECGDHIWQVITGFGTTDELRVFVTDLVESLAC